MTLIYKFENTCCGFGYWRERNFHCGSYKIRKREREVKKGRDQVNISQQQKKTMHQEMKLEITHSFYAVATGYYFTRACSCGKDLCIGETPRFIQITVRPTLFSAELPSVLCGGCYPLKRTVHPMLQFMVTTSRDK